MAILGRRTSSWRLNREMGPQVSRIRRAKTVEIYELLVVLTRPTL
jgi:hypothetical protein